jgi:hypothetical protein
MEGRFPAWSFSIPNIARFLNPAGTIAAFRP